ncbi:hypothetical protein [Pseudocnuella soli]|uniref:hypothetical protein n=1 Tax=Pseudocnuella soli TaxID=2502779 RepID=UPI001045AA72|nr:hypothetical protein [Pseudocnuella soli]
MQLPRQLKLLIILPLLAGCSWFQPTAYFFISNTSEDKKVVDIKVSIGTKGVFDDTIKYTNIQPDLKYTPYVRLPKGKYVIRVTADSDKVSVEQPINVGNDRWIFVSYGYKPPIDTVEASLLRKNFGNDTAWINPQLRGFPPSVKIHIMDKEPVHM